MDFQLLSLSAEVSVILGFLVILVGALLFISRPDTLWLQPTSPWNVIERALFPAGAVLTATGFALLEEVLRGTTGHA